MKELKKLNIKTVDHLCKHLGTNKDELFSILENTEHYIECWTKKKGNKERPITSTKGRLKDILRKLNSVLQRIEVADYMYGGKKGKSNITNAMEHLGQQMVVKNDIKSFFPNVKHMMVYRMFNKDLGCSPDVSRHLTRLTTNKGCLPQGYPTSTIIGTLVTRNMGKRLNGLAQKHKAKFTLFVDDMTMSGSDHLKKLNKLTRKIVKQESFETKPEKNENIGYNKEQIVTGAKVNKGIDVPSDKIDNINAILRVIEAKHKMGESIQEKEINSVRGKIEYVTRLNKGAGKHLRSKLMQITKNSRIISK